MTRGCCHRAAWLGGSRRVGRGRPDLRCLLLYFRRLELTGTASGCPGASRCVRRPDLANMETLRDVGKFLQALGHHCVLFLMGNTFMAGVLIYEHHTQKSVDWPG